MAAQNDRSRQLIVALAILVVILGGGYVAFSWIASDAPPPSSDVAPVAVTSKGKPTAESQRYSQSLAQYNKDHAADAEGQGKTFLSTLSTASPQPPAEKQQAAALAPQRQPQMTSVMQPAQTAPAQIVTSAPTYGGRLMTKEDSQQLMAIVQRWGGSGMKDATKASEDEYAKSLSAQISTDGSPTGDRPSTLANSVIIVEPYAQTYARLLTEINTDEASMVRAVVPDGQPYAGAQLFASGYKRLNNDVDMTFDAMVYQGRSYRVNAKPLDMETSRTALSGSVSHHYFARIILPAIASGVGATGQLFANSGQSAFVTPTGGVVASTPDTPSARNIAGTFVGGLGSGASQVINQEASQIPVKTTVVKRGEVIGIQFIGSVTSADDLTKDTTREQSTGKESAPHTGGTTVASERPPMAPTPAPAISAPAPRMPSGLRYTPPQTFLQTYQ